MACSWVIVDTSKRHTQIGDRLGSIGLPRNLAHVERPHLFGEGRVFAVELFGGGDEIPEVPRTQRVAGLVVVAAQSLLAADRVPPVVVRIATPCSRNLR